MKTTNKKIIETLENHIQMLKTADKYLVDDVTFLKDNSKSKEYKKACDDVIDLINKK